MSQQKGDLPRKIAEAQRGGAIPGGINPEMMKALQAKLNQRAIRQLVLSPDATALYVICSDNTLWAAKNPFLYNENKTDWEQINVPPQPLTPAPFTAESVEVAVQVDLPPQDVVHEAIVSEPKPLG